ELERHKAQLAGYRNNPQVSQAALEEVILRIDTAFQALNQQPGKAGQSLAGHEWLTSVRSRISIPGGTCEFDLPAYYAWQQRDPARRRADLMTWVATLEPLAKALQVLLQLVRDAGSPHKVVSQAGHFQQNLGQGRTYQLLRLRIDDSDGLVPEITAHRLLVSVRMMTPDAEGRLRPAPVDAPFELTLCA
ncbi:MAG: cell division protein ZapD, partial [Burkholderiales bacterium PBB5]